MPTATRDGADTEGPEAPRAPAVISARGLSRSFGGAPVVRGIDLTVPEGSIHALVGPSGSGKTTTVRMLTGALAPSSGTARVLGTDPRKLSTSQRQRIGYMPQLGVLFPELTIGDNLRYAASLYGVRHPKERIAEVLGDLDMGGTEKLAMGNASGGMQRRVALAAAVLHRPDLLFLDEPTAGLDPVLRQQVWESLQGLREQGRTVVVTTQIVSEATRCDRVALIADGRVLADDTPEALRRRAAGGDVMDVHATDMITTTTLEALLAHGSVRQAARIGTDGRAVRVVVDDADDVAPELQRVLADHDVELSLTERYTTPFDDVFVALLEEEGSAGA